ncbi:MAG TPA: hypothetical protein VIV60_11415 [Polyangiaceae bacterium]
MMPTDRWFRVGPPMMSAALALALFWACKSSPSDPTVGSETHFLQPCEATCPGDFGCVCGVCTSDCTEDVDCAGFDAAAICSTLSARIAEGRCSTEQTAAMCDVPCLVDSHCSSGAVCEKGYCRTPLGSTLQPIDSRGTDQCNPQVIPAAEVLVLGDSLIELSAFTAQLEHRATLSGILRDGEHFHQQASSLQSLLAEGSLSLNAQYATVREQVSARLVIMDGGETDMFQELCATEPKYDCPTVRAAVAGASKLLSQMAADGVKDVVYFFYPEPVGHADVKIRLDVLRPLIENVCGQSAVACHWVDLREPFAGHDEYLGDGFVFSDSGAAVAAEVIWQTLRTRCLVP